MAGGISAFLFAKRDLDKKRLVKMRREAKEASQA